jgi:hypothetical protein
VRVFALLDGGTAIGGSIHQLGSETFTHGVLVAAARSAGQPADRKSLLAIGTDLDRNLVGRTTDAAGANLNFRGHIVHGIVEDADRFALQLVLDDIEGAIDDTLGDRLLAVEHDVIHELREIAISELRVRMNLAFLCAVTTRHGRLPYLGRLAPYLERRCLRSLTPWVSRTPRRM